MSAETDHDQLKLLSVFHYIAAALLIILSLLPLLWFAIGIGIQIGVIDNIEGARKPSPEEGPILLAFGGVLTILAWSLATAMTLTARRIASRERYDFCLLTARVELLFIPIGTVLGIFAVQVLLRPSVIELFERRADTPKGGATSLPPTPR